MKRMLLMCLIFTLYNARSQEWKFEEIDYVTHPTWEDRSTLMYNNIMEVVNVDALGNISYEKTIVVPGASEEDMMSYCRIFVSESYGRADAVIEVDDSHLGVIIGKSIDHQFRVDAANEKARIKITPQNANIQNWKNKKGKFKGVVYSYYYYTHKTILSLVYNFEQCLQNKGYSEI